MADSYNLHFYLLFINSLWEEFRKGSHIYEIGDNGGLILMCDDDELTDRVFFTWDEGLTWEEFQFTEEKILVTNIVIEPENMAQVFHIYGEYPNGKGLILSLDFNTLH